ncbi:MAG: citrate lyase acyl carrier protein [Rouxiella aceris]|jgi:citrate lyase subunit gamma (acyl carrier protein)|uniref:Citrate lyase acyl carrier protein n=1 Tax=Rouxiella aceris TaxID=2703884 RepID=A0A848MLE4_9GAMM|nr:citrate lyase acyl carrier protein [Rouxiella aceris]MDR3430389.1 citrate lyase acyl carrier protein [Rouxiella aceris]NMP27870.1 citrate lyase acyl carrier protein [Rouxiella aceris]
MKIVQEALAGTFESSDLLVKVLPAEAELNVVLNSEVMQQFGAQIRRVIDETLAAMHITEGLIIVDDKGALDCVIRARVQSAVLRAAGVENVAWEQLS